MINYKVDNSNLLDQKFKNSTPLKNPKVFAKVQRLYYQKIKHKIIINNIYSKLNLPKKPLLPLPVY